MSRHAKKLKRRAEHTARWAAHEAQWEAIKERLRFERTIALALRVGECFVSPDLVGHELVEKLRAEGVIINVEGWMPSRTITAIDWEKFLPRLTTFDYMPAMPRFEPMDVTKLAEFDHLFRWPEFRFGGV